MPEVQARVTALQYQNRFWAEYGGSAELNEFLDMLDKLGDLGKGHPIEQNPAYTWLLRLRALKNLNVITGAPVALDGGFDFSPYGVEQRCAAGREAVRQHLQQNPAPAELPKAA
jgi:hypothetical protein